MTKVLFIRHGEANYNIIDERGFIGQGRSYAPLTEKGISQINKTACDIKLDGSELVISSPYTRALQSASIIASKLNLNLKVEVDLHEWIPDIVNYDYKSSEDCFRLYKDYNKHNGIYPKGEKKVWESKDHLSIRVKKVIDEYLKYNKIIVVCHEMVIRSFIDKEKIANGEIIPIDL